MAHRMLLAQQRVFHYQGFHIDKSQPLGHGSYGAVYKAKCDQLPCAAKVLHPTILDPRDRGAGKVVERFQQECMFLENIRHPNIVQYLGMTRDPESRLPVLLMELLDESLTKMLECSQQSLAYCIQVDICHDIALAVAYLHSNDIIHRDLSSNDVLMVTGGRAKVTDFGMSKLAGTAPSMTPLTMCPGTQAYMPPEALREPPRYTNKLDCFSEGVIMIQVCTQLWPEPGPRTQIIRDSRSLTGIVEMPVPETHRRKNHIDLIDPNHALLSIAVDCLQFQEKDRPSSEEVCQRLAGLKETREHRESVRIHHHAIQAKDYQIMAQTQQLQEKDKLLQQGADEITSLSQQLCNKDEAILDKDTQLQRQRRLLKTHQEEIESRERQLRQLSKQLEEQEQISAKTHSLQRQMEQLQQQLSQQSLKLAQPPSPQSQIRGRQLQQQLSQQSLKPPQPPPPSQSRISGRQLQQQLSQQSLKPPQPPPPSQSRISGRQLQQQPSQQSLKPPQPPPPSQSRISGRQLQQQPSQQSLKPPQPPPPSQSRISGRQLQQQLSQQSLKPPQPPPQKRRKIILNWRDGGKAPLELSRGAAVVDGNVAYFMNWNGDLRSYGLSSKSWRKLPKCPYHCCNLAIIKGQLTVIGGKDSHLECTNKLLSLQAKWNEVFPAMLTKRCSTTAVTTKEHLIVAGGSTGHDVIKTVEVLDTKALVWSAVASLSHACDCTSGTICGDQLYILGGNDNKSMTKSVLTCSLTKLLQSSSSSSSSLMWHRVADASAYRSTCAAIDGELLAVGGCDIDDKPTTAIHKYNPTTNTWDPISNMPTARYGSLVAVFPTNEMMVVGGNDVSFRGLNNVEIANYILY